MTKISKKTQENSRTQQLLQETVTSINRVLNAHRLDLPLKRLSDNTAISTTNTSKTIKIRIFLKNEQAYKSQKAIAMN